MLLLVDQRAHWVKILQTLHLLLDCRWVNPLAIDLLGFTELLTLFQAQQPQLLTLGEWVTGV